ncbi:polysaccharide lyase family 8 protein [Coprinellus micaceus]|uniref:Polysaccharide lyase family 8 protein n=1 Tax=Coprinellus micaceus TaxID=71717 RepID=A0A4Y7RC60_COPMI|nr:polysaccharide lyase family 8 protein [Coprinellus micaceus]
MTSLRTPPSGRAALTLFLLHTCLSLLFFSPTSAAGASQLLQRQLYSRHQHPTIHPYARQNGDGTAGQMATVYDRRVASILDDLPSSKDISTLLNSLNEDGQWPQSEVDLTTGCEARRANWPAQQHWRRIVVMAAAWHGGLDNSQQWYQSGELLNATRKAMGYWFGRDFKNDACLDNGGKAACPCDNPDNSLWNTNWYSNVILIPELVGQTCLLLNSTLTSDELLSCGHITSRGYSPFYRAKRPGFLAGANVLDIGRIGVDAALITANYTLLVDAYQNIHGELTIRDEVKADGIRPDGSFGQHLGVLYNGNYGKDYSNAVLDLEISAAETQLEASASSKSALETLFEGNKWMIIANTLTGVLHWDLSAIGRMITFPVADNQASANLRTNLTTVLKLGNLWSSEVLKSYVYSLQSNQGTANAGNKLGNMLFFANDYMVHRGSNYVSTLKMYSSRTLNTECLFRPKDSTLAPELSTTTSQATNTKTSLPLGTGNLIPGITTDYQNTPLSCNDTEQTGFESFVGGVSDGRSGISVMRYTNPITKALSYQKAWFFTKSGLEHVVVNIHNSTSDKPVYTVLDQKRRSGDTKAQGRLTSKTDSSRTYTRPDSLWHADVGYTFPSNTQATLNLKKGEATGNWLDIGNVHPASYHLEYTVWPGICYSDFQRKQHRSPIQTVANGKDASAIYERDEDRLMLVFWNAQGGSVTFRDFGIQFPPQAPFTISTTVATTLIVSLEDGSVVASDPSQALDSTIVTFKLGPGRPPKFWTGGRTKVLNLTFPKGGAAGSSVTAKL